MVLIGFYMFFLYIFFLDTSGLTMIDLLVRITFGFHLF